MFLFVDTELAGPFDDKLYLDDPAQPQCFQIAAILDDVEQMTGISLDVSARQDGFQMTVNSTASYVGERGGVFQHRHQNAYQTFLDMVDSCQFIIGHNVTHDRLVLRRELALIGEETWYKKKNFICTMKHSIEPCRRWLNGKWPSLPEAYHLLFGESLGNHHNAMADAWACRRIFYHLLKGGHLRVPNLPKSEPLFTPKGT